MKSKRDNVKRILSAALWFGLVTGLVEGTALWILHRLGRLPGIFRYLVGSVEVVSISTVFGLLLFLTLGLALGLVAWVFPRLRVERAAVLIFTFLLFLDWFAIYFAGRVRIWMLAAAAVWPAIELARQFAKDQAAVERVWRKSLPWIGTLSLLAAAGIPAGLWLQEQAAVARLPDAAPGAPNVLVIVVDTLRADHVSSYGYARATSPNLDRLAEQGVLFENAFSTSSWTPPAHASILTGRYPHEHGADNLRPLGDRYTTIAEALQARGYRTGAFSAGYQVFNRSFGFGRGFHHFEDYYWSVANMTSSTLYGGLFERYVYHDLLGFENKIDRKLAEDVNPAVLRWVDRDPGRPFFVFINYFDVHDPYVPPQPYRSQFSSLEDPGGLINTSYDMDHIYLPLTEQQLQGEIDAYDGSIAYVDDQLGRLIDELHERALIEDTLVVVMADHGESFGEHGLFHHINSLYREVIHVPLVFWWPGRIPRGVRVETPVTTTSLPGTLLQLVDGSQDPFPGPLLAEPWSAPNAGRKEPPILAEIEKIEWVNDHNPTAFGNIKAVITPQWYYIVHQEFGEELYDWQVDPGASTDLSEHPEYHLVMDRFRAQLEVLVTNAVAWLR